MPIESKCYLDCPERSKGGLCPECEKHQKQVKGLIKSAIVAEYVLAIDELEGAVK